MTFGPFDVAVAAILVGGATQLLRGYWQHQGARRAVADAALPPALDERLRRMEQALEAVAVEVERISEGQRFTTRLLAERTSPSAAAPTAPAWQETAHAAR